jgi:hypothetical protein
MYLVDTNIVSEARRGTPQAVSWLRSVDPLSIHLSALTLGEIMRGIASALHRMVAQAAPRPWRPHFADNQPNRGRMGPHRGNPPLRRYRRVDCRDCDRPRSHPCHTQRQGFRRHRRLRDQPLGELGVSRSASITRCMPAFTVSIRWRAGFLF